MYQLSSILSVLSFTLFDNNSVHAFTANKLLLSRNNYIKNHYNDDILVLCAEKIGIFFGTSTGNTEEVAEMISNEFGSDIASAPIDIDSVGDNLAEEFSKYDALIVGTPTWNTGADTERSGTAWDELYYGPEFDACVDILKNKPVAVFGCGDSDGYADNYCDAMGEIHDVFLERGNAKMLGYVSDLEDYEHEESKAQREDHFVGLALDQVNFDDLTPDRITNWVTQLKKEGILSDGSSSDSTATTTLVEEQEETATVVVLNDDNNSIDTSSSEGDETASLIIAKLEEENAELRRLLEEKVETPKEYAVASQHGFTPHYNSASGCTMWTSKDGRQCYYTEESNKAVP